MLNPTVTALKRFLAPLPSRLESWAHRHRRPVSLGILALMLGSGLTAFGVAPLSLAPPEPPASVRTVSASLEVPELQDQLQQLDLVTLALHRNDLTRVSDTADSLLSRLGLNDPEAAAFLRSDVIARRVLSGRVGKQVQVDSVDTVGGGRLQRLIARGPATDSQQADTHFSRITVERTAEGLRSRIDEVALGVEPRLGAGTIQSSLFAAADDAGLPDAVTVQMAEIFSVDLDFRRELRKGDSFSVVYEVLTADGQPVTWNSGIGRVQAAQFINKGKTHEAVWFRPQDADRGGYFSAEGVSKVRSFLSSPLAFSRVTSGFAMRLHPIHKQWRAHLGVDYAAPTGTPVRSVGDGQVEFAGVQGGYGNVVIVAHRGGNSTVYAHLSRIDVTRGATIAQGQTLGAVGSTGWSTGPHLHFEFKVGGVQVDPVQIARSSEAIVLSAAERARFTPLAGAARAGLAQARRDPVTLARME